MNEVLFHLILINDYCYILNFSIDSKNRNILLRLLFGIGDPGGRVHVDVPAVDGRAAATLAAREQYHRHQPWPRIPAHAARG